MNETKEQIIERLVDEVSEMRRQIAELRREVDELKAQGTVRKPSEEQAKERQPPKLGETIMEMGYLTELQLGWSLRKQEREAVSSLISSRRRLLGEIMVESGIITKEQLKKGLTEQQKKT